MDSHVEDIVNDYRPPHLEDIRINKISDKPRSQDSFEDIPIHLKATTSNGSFQNENKFLKKAGTLKNKLRSKVRYWNPSATHRFKTHKTLMQKKNYINIDNYTKTDIHDVPMKIIRHRDIYGVLAVGKYKGFTISNGLYTVSKETSLGGNSKMAEIIRLMGISNLILINEEAKSLWLDIKKSHLNYFKDVKEVFLEPYPNASVCKFCKEKNCHRWLAIMIGINRFKKNKLEPIKH